MLQWVVGAIEFDSLLSNTENPWLIMIVVGLVLEFATAFWEELLVRGYLLTVLGIKVGLQLAIVISAITFALLHFFFQPGPLITLVNLSLLGVLCALAVIRYGSLWAAIGIHLGWNFVQYHGTPIIHESLANGLANFIPNPDIAWYLVGSREYGIEATILATVVLLISLVLLGQRSPALTKQPPESAAK